MLLALLVLSALLIIGFIRFRSQKNQEIQEESSQVTEETPSPNFDISYLHEEILSSPEPEEDPAVPQGEVISEPKPKKSPVTKKSSTKGSSTKKTSGKKAPVKKSTPKKSSK